MGNVINKNRYLIISKYFRNYYYEKIIIKKRFAILPTNVDNKIVWFKFYYSLYKLNAFSFGGNVDISYSFVGRGLSIFSFRFFIKKDIFINKIREKRNRDEIENKLPDWWKNMLKEFKDE